MLRPIALVLCIGSAAAAFDASTGYGLTGVKKCLTANEACPASAQSVCPSAAKVTECDNPWSHPDSSLAGIASALYTWSRADSTPAMTLATIPAGVSWNQFTDSDGDALEYAGTCGALGSCSNAYTKVVHVFDTDNCWPRSMAIPVIGNAESPDAQMALCANTIKHLLGKKPLGAFVLSPTEQLEYFLLNKPVITCGNYIAKNGQVDSTRVQPPFLQGEGGGGTYGYPWTYAEETGMCYSGNSALGDGYKVGGERYGGSVTTEEYGHTIFDVGISQFDPEGWLAVQKAEALAYQKYVANNNDLGGHERDSDWDCHTASTEYFAVGVEMLLYNTRIGPNHKATTRTQLRDNDPNLWCLAARYYEINNKFTPCPAGPTISDVAQTVDCKATLIALGVTTFGPEGSNGANFGGAKTNSSAIVSSSAACNAGTTCAGHPNGTVVTGATQTSTAATRSKTSSAAAVLPFAFMAALALVIA